MADYPAHLEVVYPERLSRGLVLVKWWLLALPHYVVVAFFVGGGLFAVDATSQDSRPALLGGGLIGLLVMNTDGTPGVSAAVQAGATFPAIAWIISGLLFAAGYFLLLGIALLIIGSTSRRGNRSAPNEVAPPSGQDDRTPASA